MISYNNISDFKEIHYNGIDVSKAYTSDGLVWSKTSPEPPQPTGTTTAITYTASSKLNVKLSAFTPNATAETFADGVGTIEFANNVTAIGEAAFVNCRSLTSINIPNSVTTIGGYAFWKCESLSSITIPSGITIIGEWAFNECIALTSCTIGSGVTRIGYYAFTSCSGLTSVTIPSGVTRIGEYAFEGCTRLTSIKVEATTPPKLEVYGGQFYNTNECPIYVPYASVSAYQTAWDDYANRIQAIQ